MRKLYKKEDVHVERERGRERGKRERGEREREKEREKAKERDGRSEGLCNEPTFRRYRDEVRSWRLGQGIVGRVR